MNMEEAFVYFQHGFGPKSIWDHHCEHWGTLSHLSHSAKAFEAAELYLYLSNLHKWHGMYLQTAIRS
jgi:hypothetical protein